MIVISHEPGIAKLAPNPLAEATTDYAQRHGLSDVQLVLGIGTVEQLSEVMNAKSIPGFDRPGTNFARRLARRVGYTRQQYRAYVRALTIRNVGTNRQADWIWKIEAPTHHRFGQAILVYLRKDTAQLKAMLREIRGCAYGERERRLKLLITNHAKIFTPNGKGICRFASHVARYIGHDLSTEILPYERVRRFVRAQAEQITKMEREKTQIALKHLRERTRLAKDIKQDEAEASIAYKTARLKSTAFQSLIDEFPSFASEMKRRQITDLDAFLAFIAKGRDIKSTVLTDQCLEFAASLQPNDECGLKPIVRIIESACGGSVLKNTLFVKRHNVQQPTTVNRLAL